MLRFYAYKHRYQVWYGFDKDCLSEKADNFNGRRLTDCLPVTCVPIIGHVSVKWGYKNYLLDTDGSLRVVTCTSDVLTELLVR